MYRSIDCGKLHPTEKRFQINIGTLVSMTEVNMAKLVGFQNFHIWEIATGHADAISPLGKDQHFLKTYSENRMIVQSASVIF